MDRWANPHYFLSGGNRTHALLHSDLRAFAIGTGPTRRGPARGRSGAGTRSGGCALMGKASARKRLRRQGAGRLAAASVGTGILWQWFLGLVAVVLLATGLALLAFSVVPTVADWARMRHWQPVPAQVESARLHQGAMARGGMYYAAVVRYRYVAQGTQHTGARAAVDGSGDSFRSFHQELADRLHNAQRRGVPVQVWVNPQNPAESVVDRSLRAGPLVWNLVIACFTAGAGLVGLVMVVGAIRQERRGRKTRRRADGLLHNS